MVEKIKEITKKDENFFHIKLEKFKGFNKEAMTVELTSRKKEDKSDNLIKKAKGLLDEM